MMRDTMTKRDRELPALVLSADELVALTGYKQPAKQLRKLHELGFVRSWINAAGALILPRVHYEAVKAGTYEPGPFPGTPIPPAKKPVTRTKRAAMLRRLARRRRTAEKQRTPAWADPAAIRAVYAEAKRLAAETGIPHEVDHEIPLRGEFVSGLHVHHNLRPLPKRENRRKRNRYEP
jgi:hypothetical protein